jgi:hypothetical protein
MTSNLQKLSATAKLAAVFLLFLLFLENDARSQVFPSQVRLTAGAEYNIYSIRDNAIDASVSPNAFLGAIMEFKQLYAIQLTLHGNMIRIDTSSIESKEFPTLGFSYDLILKLYRSDPPAFFTPIGSLGFSKQWSIKTGDAAIETVMNDVSDWQFKSFVGADFAFTEKFHVKPLAGAAISMGEMTYFEKRVSPVFRVSAEAWF